MSCFNFEYYLNDVQIFEPFNFDGANIKIEQKENSFARDVYLFNEGVELSFYKNEFTGGLTHGFDLITSAINEKGADADISFSIKNNGVSYFLGRLDLENMITDGVNFVKVKTIDEGGRFLFKRDFETKKKIELAPLKVLLKAKPVEQISEWVTAYPITVISDMQLFHNSLGNLYSLTTMNAGINALSLIKSNIKNSVIPFYSTTPVQTYLDRNYVLREVPINNNSKYVISATTLSNLTINVKNIIGKAILKNLFGLGSGTNVYTNINSKYKLVMLVSDGDIIAGNFDYYVLWETNLYLSGLFSEVIEENIPTNIDFSLNEISQGQRLHFYFISEPTANTNTSIYSLERVDSFIELQQCEITITSTSTAINSVIETHRWKDLMSATSNLPVNAPLFEDGGEFYDVVLTNGYGIRSIRGKDFTTTTKNVFDIDFMAMDYQINNDVVEVATFDEFYPENQTINIEELTADSIEYTPNKRFRLSDLKFGYKNFEQDRDEQNTLDSVHTYSEWKMPNKYTQGKFERTTDIIFDPYKIESSRRLGFEDRTKNSSLSDDDDLFGISITGIGNEIYQQYKGTFAQNTSGNELQLLTNAFSWYSTGIEVGSNVTITGSNAGTYTVIEINNIGNILKLSGTNNGANVEEVLTINYTLTGVLYKSRTFEGFGTIDGVANPTNYGNLIFQQKRIINRWLRYLATVKKYYPNDLIKQTYFKNNKFLKVDGIDDSTDFDATNQILNENIVKIEVKCSFVEAYFIAQEMVRRRTDGSIGGFITIDGISGFIKDFEYSIGTAILNLTLEQKEMGYLISQSDEYILTQTGDNIQLQ